MYLLIEDVHAYVYTYIYIHVADHMIEKEEARSLADAGFFEGGFCHRYYTPCTGIGNGAFL